MVNTVFQGQIGRNIEAYVDDLLVKSMSDLDHVRDLRETFATLNSASMKLNPKKSFFGLTDGKFLGFMVSMRGIEIHPSKSQAILDMKPPEISKSCNLSQVNWPLSTGLLRDLGMCVFLSLRPCASRPNLNGQMNVR